MARKRKTPAPAPELPHTPLVNDDVCKILALQGPGVDSGQLAKDLIEVWGGPRKLAEDIHREFMDGTRQSRQRILEMIQRLIVTNTTHAVVQSESPADMDQGDLEREALELMRKGTNAGGSTGAVLAP
jgi:hypothetical protein